MVDGFSYFNCFVFHLFISLPCSKGKAAWCEFFILNTTFTQCNLAEATAVSRREDSPAFALGIRERGSGGGREVDRAGAGGVTPLPGKWEPSPPSHFLVLFHMRSEMQASFQRVPLGPSSLPFPSP